MSGERREVRFERREVSDELFFAEFFGVVDHGDEHFADFVIAQHEF